MKTILSIAILLLLVSCERETVPEEVNFEEFVTLIPASEQRGLGDPNAGLDYLIYGDYISSGFPYDFFVENFPDSSNNELGRDGLSSNVPFSFNVVKASNGIDIVAPNCLQCHAQYLNGEFILGLGNYASDYTFDQSFTLSFSEQILKERYGESSLEWEAFEAFSKASQVSSPYLITEVKGVNPADKLTAVLAAHRDPQTLEWLDNPQYSIPDGLIPTDVPPLWLMKKKNALYYTGSGRGDFARLMTLAEILTMPDTVKAKEVDEKFTNVYTFLKNIEAPEYPFEIDNELAAKGALLFADHCAKCHGSGNYPNLLIDVEYVGTDPELAEANFAYADFLNWYNTSWYSKGAYPAYFESTKGYIAPPLDGIWATAPYLHNGSIPNLEVLLDSEERPDYWKRSEIYNYETLGWNYVEFSAGAGSTIYDTSKKGYGNQGHVFGDVLNSAERLQVIEYLKTL
jgi:mono/diheme cytochrome c family protein